MMPSPPIYYISPSCGGALTAGEGSSSRPEIMTLAGNVCDYTFSGARGETIWVAASKDIASSPFQPVLVLMKPGFAAADPPEATGDNTIFSGMAVIRNHILAQTGRYTVRVSDYGDDDTGSFFIMLWKR
jgi:hypothetical protein